MVTKDFIIKELVKNGYANEGGKRVWDVANMSFLYLTRDMAEGFLKLKEHPRYKATIVDIEINLLKKHAIELLKEFSGQSINLVDLGCSDGAKAKALIRGLESDIEIRYCPVSVNEHLVNLSLRNLKEENFKKIVDYAPRVIPDFDSVDVTGIALRNNKYQRNVILLLGSLLGGFEVHDYLFKLSNSMLPGCTLIIGNGIRTGERFVNLEAYKSPVFDRWFVHLIKALGFKENEAEYDARFANGRVEGFYKLKVNKTLEFGKRKYDFKREDEIIVAVLYKYYADELENFCRMYFSDVKLFKDPEEEYVLIACRK